MVRMRLTIAYRLLGKEAKGEGKHEMLYVRRWGIRRDFVPRQTPVPSTRATTAKELGTSHETAPRLVEVSLEKQVRKEMEKVSKKAENMVQKVEDSDHMVRLMLMGRAEEKPRTEEGSTEDTGKEAEKVVDMERGRFSN